MEKWEVEKVGNYWYSVLRQNRNPVATQISDEGLALLIAQLPQLKELRYDWSVIINRLAHIALDGGNSNDMDFAQDMIEVVRPYLGGAVLED